MTSRDAFFSLAKQSFRKLGYHTNDRIVVFESDDWGALRVPSVDVLNAYKQRYPDHQLDHYQSYDTLDTAEDIRLLCDVLRGRSNRDGYHPVFTLNFATANPLFGNDNERHENPFQWEDIQSTYQRYCSKGYSPLDVMKERLVLEVVHPQLHGREHLNVTVWRDGILTDDRLRFAYELGMVGLNPGRYCGLDSLNQNNTDVQFDDYLLDATLLFENLFGFKSESFIPPCYVISPPEESQLSSLGVMTLQSGWLTNRSRHNGSLCRRPTVMGSRTRTGLVRLVRNCQFEPSRWFFAKRPAKECVLAAMRHIEEAFAAKQPAVVCTHRVNYVGGISEENRAYGLFCLDLLLSRIVCCWPDIQFMTSDTLGNSIAK